MRAEKVAVTRADRTSSRSGGLLPLQGAFQATERFGDHPL